MPAATERVRHYDPFSAFITDAIIASAAMEGVTPHKVNLTLGLTGWAIANGVDVNWGDGTNEVQTLTKTGTWTSGTYTITFRGETTAPIAVGANAATIQAALEALNGVGAGNIVVSGGPLSTTAVVLTFSLFLGAKNVPAVTVDVTSVVGTTPGVGVVETTPGAGGTTETTALPQHTYGSAVGATTIRIRGVDAHGVPLTQTAAVTVT